MRRLVVVVLGALVLAGAAHATSAPPYRGLHTITWLPVLDLPPTSRARESCSAHARATRTAVSRFERKLGPVACEQPPRAKVRDAATIVLAP